MNELCVLYFALLALWRNFILLGQKVRLLCLDRFASIYSWTILLKQDMNPTGYLFILLNSWKCYSSFPLHNFMYELLCFTFEKVLLKVSNASALRDINNSEMFL